MDRRNETETESDRLNHRAHLLPGPGGTSDRMLGEGRGRENRAGGDGLLVHSPSGVMVACH